MASRSRDWRLWLIALVVFAAAVRLVGLNWDDAHFFHPDERRIAFAIEELSFSPLQLNPHFFAYGSFPLYVDRAVSSFLGLFAPYLGRYASIIHAGRALSAVVGTLTVILLFFLGTRLYNRQVGMLAAFLLAACVLHLQNSHYITTDVFLTFLVLLALYFLVGVVQRGWTRDYVYAGIAIGLAAATKFSALPLLLPFGVAALIRLGQERRLLPILGRSLLALAVLALAFAIGQPYALLDFPAYSHDIAEQSRMVRSAGLYPYTNQYLGTPKYLYELTQIVLWGMAPPLGLAAIIATGLRVVGAVRERSAVDLMLLSWVLPFFLVTGWFDVKFVRYLLPIYPIAILWAAAWLWRTSRTSRVAQVGLWTVVIGTGLAALAFLSIYWRPHTVVASSEWAYRHIPAGSVILSQHWDEGFPMPLRGGNRSPGRFKVINLPYYEPDTSTKMQQISRELAGGDYIAFQTKRLYGAITQADKKFPLTNNYFKLLFAGDLGYTLIYDHASRPGLLGFEFPDELADESITVYDHPKVLIFQNTGHLPAEEIFDKILRGMPSRQLDREDLLLAEAGQQGSFTSSWRGTPIRSSWLALFWFAACVELLGLCGFALLYRWMPVPGCYAAAKVLGLLTFAYLPWVASTLGTGFTRGALFFTLVLMVVLGLLAFWRWERRPERAEWWSTEILFWAVFGLFLTVRAFNPEVYWGEKPMDFAFLNGLTRTSSLPPPEPWFSGSVLHYTYFGHYLVAALGKLCHIYPGITFNLGIALFGALTATAAFAAGCAITDRWRVGLLAAFFVSLIGNLAGLREILARQAVNFDYFWATSRVIKNTINEYPLWSFLFADLHAHVLVMPFSLTFLALAVWWARRRHTGGTIRPVPLFLLLSLALGAIMVTNGWSSPTYVLFFPLLLACAQLGQSGVGRGRVALAALLTLFLLVPALALQVIEPEFLAEFLGARGWHPDSVYANATLATLAAVALVIVPGVAIATAFLVVLAYLLYYPFWTHFSPPPRNWGLENQSFANFWDYANIFGLFLFVAVPFLFLLWRRQLLPWSRERLGGFRSLALWVVGLTAAACLLLSVPAIAQLLPGGLDVRGSLRLGLAIFAVVGLNVALRRTLTWPQRVSAIMLFFAFAITAGTDVIYVWDRMNTIFKFYLESWFLFGIAAAVAASELWSAPTIPRILRHGWQAGLLVLVALGLFTATTAIYGVFTTRRVPTDRPTLDGTAYLAQRNPQENAAFEWLNDNIAGIPVIAEAHGPSYQDFSRVSMNTGLPTVLGWDYHVHQRSHGWPDIRRRKADLEKLYSSENERTVSDILDRYNVSLVFLGALERRTYKGGNKENFEQWTDLLTPIYENRGVTVYAVNGQFTGATPVKTIEEVPQVEEEGEEVFVQAREGELSQPRGVAVDADGNVYVADFGNNRIQKYDAELQYLEGWGERGTLPGQFKQASDIAIGADGNVYVADTWNQRVQVFDPDGKYLREWGGSYYGPRGIAIGPDKSIYLADTGNHKIWRFDPQGTEDLTWGGLGSERGQFTEPVGIAADAEGRVYVADNGNARLQIFSADGRFLSAFDVEGWQQKVFSEPQVAVAPDGTIWVTVPVERAVRAYDAEGNLLEEFVGSEEGGGLFRRPMGVAYWPETEDVIVTDLDGRVLRLPREK